ncbi:MAG: VWA domain-containing protein [Candidatus Scalinduaceae bacterium]
MKKFRYSKWDGSQEYDFKDPKQLMDQISDSILRHGVDLNTIIEQSDLDASILEDEGYIKMFNGSFIISTKGLKRMERKALLEIFTSMKEDSRGSHESNFKGNGTVIQEESKYYEYGDPLSNLDLNSTLKNSLRRAGPSLPIEVEKEDFMIYESEAQPGCATVLLLDMSGSMFRYGKFYEAKKVALALQGIVRTQFPNDRLYFVGFYSFSRELKLRDLPYVMPRPVRIFDSCIYLEIKKEDMGEYKGRIPEHFTNIHAGLRLSRKILSKETCNNKQIMLITDGEPTAHYEGDTLVLIYPPNDRTAKETLREARNCRKDGILINTFALIDDYYYFDLANFVGRLTKVNRGRAFYPTSEELGRYILDDFVSSRRKKLW